MELDLYELRLTPLEYARNNGLTVDYASQQLEWNIVSPSIAQLTSNTNEGSLEDMTSMWNAVTQFTKEKLTVGHDAVVLLHEVLSKCKQPDNAYTAIDEDAEKIKNVLRKKLEIPLLLTDNALDLREFGRTTMPDLRDLKIPQEPLDTECDESYEWPCAYQSYPQRCLEQIKVEKLAVNKESLLFLQNSIRNVCNARDVEEVMMAEMSFKKVCDSSP